MSNPSATWLVTGGAGYIGAHVVRAFSKAGIEVVVLDDLSTGFRQRIPEGLPFIQGDASNADLVHDALLTYSVVGVVHLAAYKHARESVRDPVLYWGNNMRAMLGVIEALDATSVRHFVLSSSCSIYGASGPVDSLTPANPLSPYARTKQLCEQILDDCGGTLGLSWLALRYFNVIGNDRFPWAHDTSAECLVPATVARVLRGEPATVYGTDFSTPDGTALRDYVDVRDLASAHLAAARYLMAGESVGMALDIGTGAPLSVLEVVQAIYDELGQTLCVCDAGRASADPSAVWSNASTIRSLLGWTPTHDLHSSIREHVRSLCGTPQAKRQRV